MSVLEEAITRCKITGIECEKRVIKGAIMRTNEKRFIIKDIGNKVKRSELYNGIKIRVALTGGDYIYCCQENGRPDSLTSPETVLDENLNKIDICERLLHGGKKLVT